MEWEGLGKTPGIFLGQAFYFGLECISKYHACHANIDDFVTVMQLPNLPLAFLRKRFTQPIPHYYFIDLKESRGQSFQTRVGGGN